MVPFSDNVFKRRNLSLSISLGAIEVLEMLIWLSVEGILPLNYSQTEVQTLSLWFSRQK